MPNREEPLAGQGEMSSAVRLEGVSRAFMGRPVLRDFHLEVGAGEIVCLLGPSGCGKTTLLNITAGLLPPDAGRVHVQGRLGYVFQEPRLLPWRTVHDNIAFGLKAMGMPSMERDARVEDYVARMGLAGAARLYPHQLSGGMRQRVALARALIIEPDVLLLDEPFKSLDVLLRLDLLGLLLAEWRRRPRAMLFVTHDVEEAALVAHRVVLLAGSPPLTITAELESTRPPDERHPGDAEVQTMAARIYDVLLKQHDRAG